MEISQSSQLMKTPSSCDGTLSMCNHHVLPCLLHQENRALDSRTLTTTYIGLELTSTFPHISLANTNDMVLPNCRGV